jgi:hypothetical protein
LPTPQGEKKKTAISAVSRFLKLKFEMCAAKRRTAATLEQTGNRHHKF